jgi:hypothetical protein
MALAPMKPMPKPVPIEPKPMAKAFANMTFSIVLLVIYL